MHMGIAGVAKAGYVAQTLIKAGVSFSCHAPDNSKGHFGFDVMEKDSGELQAAITEAHDGGEDGTVSDDRFAPLFVPEEDDTDGELSARGWQYED